MAKGSTGQPNAANAFGVSPPTSQLPIDAVLPELLGALDHGPNAILAAPPGAGKTTRVPLALLDRPWRGGRRIVLLSPRRLAARAAAQRMAETLGESVGQTVGLRARLDTRVGAKTRIEVVTEGVFARMLLDDPALDGIAAVLFDEFHERSLDADLGLTLARDAQLGLREDLHLLVMSATLDVVPVKRVLGDVPLIRSNGRAYPVETRYLGRDPARGMEDQAASAVRRVIEEETGSVLCFLPGAREIRRTAERLHDRLPPDCDVVPLYGALDRRAQQRAIDPAPDGARKIVLASAVAETSLTIEGVRIVIDSGLSRVPRFDPGTRLTRLETVRVTQASAEQRRGRAGRLEPGICYRLWSEPETAALAAHGRPEILDADLSGLLVTLALWGVTDPRDLTWPEPPPAPALNEARSELLALGIIDPGGRLTETGREASKLPMAPPLGRMLVDAGSAEDTALAARIAVILSEQGLGGRDTDLRVRLGRLAQDRGEATKRANDLAGRWSAQAGAAKARPSGTDAAGRMLALAYPDRVAKRRPGRDGAFLMANGRGAVIDPSDPLAAEPFLAIAEAQGGGADLAVRLAAPITATEIDMLFGDAIDETDAVTFDRKTGRVAARRSRTLGAITLSAAQLTDPDPVAVAEALTSGIRATGIDRLPWSEAQMRLRQRTAFARRTEPDACPDLSDASLATTLEHWLTPHLVGLTRLDAITAATLGQALDMLLPHGRRRALDRLVPDRFTTPGGVTRPIDYGAEAGPTVSLRVQDLYGLDTHPAAAGLPLVLELLSPAHRPIQTTRDLPGFWRGSWADVRRDMRGRYPKHDWPEEPWKAPPRSR